MKTSSYLVGNILPPHIIRETAYFANVAPENDFSTTQ